MAPREWCGCGCLHATSGQCQCPLCRCLECHPEATSLDGRTVLLVKCGSSGRWRLLKALHEAGIKIVCLNETAPEWARPFVHEWIINPMTDHADILAAVRAYLADAKTKKADPATATATATTSATSSPIEGVLCYDAYGLFVSQQISTMLNLPCVPQAVIDRFRDKISFRENCRAAGIPTPGFVRLNGAGVDLSTASLEELEQFLVTHNLAFPLVVKPSRTAGKYGVRLVKSAADLHAAILDFRGGLQAFCDRWALPMSEADGLMAEEYLEGEEVDVDCIVDHGKVVFASINANRTASEPYFVEAGGMCPPELPHADRKALIDLTQQVMAMGHESLSGCFHFEAKLTPTGAVPIENNLRIGGAETYTMVKLAYNVDLIQAAAKLCLGVRLRAADYPNTLKEAPCRYVASINFNPDWQGSALVNGQDVPASVLEDKDYGDHELYYAPGNVVDLPPAGKAYLGWLAATGTTAAEAQANLDRFNKAVQFDLAVPPV